MIKHTEPLGCSVVFLRNDVVERRIMKDGKIKEIILKIYYCETHDKELCSCGIEWGRHSEYYLTLAKK